MDEPQTPPPPLHKTSDVDMAGGAGGYHDQQLYRNSPNLHNNVFGHNSDSLFTNNTIGNQHYRRARRSTKSSTRSRSRSSSLDIIDQSDVIKARAAAPSAPASAATTAPGDDEWEQLDEVDQLYSPRSVHDKTDWSSLVGPTRIRHSYHGSDTSPPLWTLVQARADAMDSAGDPDRRDYDGRADHDDHDHDAHENDNDDHHDDRDAQHDHGYGHDWQQAGANADALDLAGPGAHGKLLCTVLKPQKENEGTQNQFISYLVTTHVRRPVFLSFSCPHPLLLSFIQRFAFADKSLPLYRQTSSRFKAPTRLSAADSPTLSFYKRLSAASIHNAPFLPCQTSTRWSTSAVIALVPTSHLVARTPCSDSSNASLCTPS